LAVWSGNKFIQTAVLGYIFIYVQIKHYYIIPYMCWQWGEGGDFKPQKTQYNYNKKMSTCRAKPIRITEILSQRSCVDPRLCLFDICGAQSGIRTDTSVFTCQCHSTNTPHSLSRGLLPSQVTDFKTIFWCSKEQINKYTAVWRR